MATKREPDKTFLLYKKTVKIEFYDSSHRYMVSFLKKGEWTKPERKTGVTTYVHVIDKSQALIFWALKLAKNYLNEIVESGGNITQKEIEESSWQHRKKLDEACDLGTQVHELAENYINAKLVKKRVPKINPDEYDDRVYRGYLAFIDWVKQHGVQFVGTEDIVYSKKHDFVGLMDTKFTLKSEKHKIIHPGDFKTGKYKENKKKKDGFWKVDSICPYPEHRFQVSAYQGADEEETGKEFGSKWIMYFSKETGDFTAFEIPKEEHKKDFKAFLGCVAIKRRLSEI